MLSKFVSWVKTLLKRLLSLFKEEGDDVLNKELLLCGGQGVKGTHTLTVGYETRVMNPGTIIEVSNTVLGFATPAMVGGTSNIGDLTPRTVGGITIDKLGWCSAQSGGYTFGIGTVNPFPNPTTLKVTNLENGMSTTLGSEYFDLSAFGGGAGYRFTSSQTNILSGCEGKTIQMNIEIV